VPELPEVETVRRGLERALPGRRIVAVIAPDHEPTWLAWQAAWQVALSGRAIHAVRRRAKFLILDLDDDLALVVHLRMTGALTVNRASDGSLTMDFPAAPAAKIDDSQGLAAALGAPLLWAGRAHIDQLLAVVADETAVRSVAPDLVALAQFDVDGVIVTAVADAGSGYDFVSRMFAPRVGIPEDPVTGSSHTVLGPYWAGQLGKDSLVALQVSDRAGRVGVEVRGDRVLLTGRATTVLDGTVVGASAR